MDTSCWFTWVKVAQLVCVDNVLIHPRRPSLLLFKLYNLSVASNPVKTFDPC